MARSPESIPHRTSPLTILGIATFLFVLIAGGFYFARRSGDDLHRYQNDFNVYYFASHEVIEGRDPYANSLGEWTPYLYLPLLAELLIPLSLMPLQSAAYSWFLIGAASLIGAAGMSATLTLEDANENSSSPVGKKGVLPHRSRKRRYILAALSIAVVSRFALDNFDYGQVNTLVAALAVAHVCLYKKHRKLTAAVALAVAASIKLTPLVLIVYYVSRRKITFIAGCVALFISITALSFAPFGTQATAAFQTFFHRTVKNEQGFNLADPGNQSLRGAIARLRGNEGESASAPSDPITLAISVAMLAGSALVALREKGSSSSIASLFCCIPLLSPLAWKGHFVVLIFPAAFLISEVASRPRTRLGYSMTAVLIAAFAVFNLTSPRIIGLAPSEWVDRHSLICAAAMLMYMATIWCALRPAQLEAGKSTLNESSHELHE